jgi:hypothetical protein
MSESCGKHHHEKGVDLCRRCGHTWCGTCLVYAFGPKKPPFCMSCAMLAGGVRSSATLPAMPRRERKARVKAMRAEARSARDAELIPDPEAEVADASVEADWAAPWWEDREPTMAE